MAALPQMRWKNTNADTCTYGAGGFSSILPEVQILLCDLFQKWKNGRNQNARRLDAVQTEKIGLCCVSYFKLLNKNHGGIFCEKQRAGRDRPTK